MFEFYYLYSKSKILKVQNLLASVGQSVSKLEWKVLDEEVFPDRMVEIVLEFWHLVHDIDHLDEE